TLSLTATKRRGWLTERYVAEADIDERIELTCNRWHVFEETRCRLDSHSEHVSNCFIFISYLERFAVVALTVTFITSHVDVGQEVHLNFYDAITLTIFTPTTLNIETKTSGFVSTNICFRRTSKQFTYWRKHTGISRRVRSWCTTDG